MGEILLKKQERQSLHSQIIYCQEIITLSHHCFLLAPSCIPISLLINTYNFPWSNTSHRTIFFSPSLIHVSKAHQMFIYLFLQKNCAISICKCSCLLDYVLDVLALFSIIIISLASHNFVMIHSASDFSFSIAFFFIFWVHWRP
ncbi:hypothetical protein E2542_SST24831 [Spatholobus suberectus]|nr:hypothetical protein E2542_SST24831 [Spatholobus suberectus]